MSKKYYIIGGIILFLLISMVGLLIISSRGTPTATGDIVLTWWKPFEDEQNVQGLIQDYETAHKNVTINFIKKDVSSYENDLLNGFASGTAPDILSVHNDWLPEQIDRLAPMPDAMTDIRAYKNTFADVASDDFVKDSKI